MSVGFVERGRAFHISGGLGNQLFMVTAAAYFGLESEKSSLLKVAVDQNTTHNSSIFDISLRQFLGDYFDLVEVKRTRRIERVVSSIGHRHRITKVAEVGYVPMNFLSSTGTREIFGYFQTHRYMDEMRKLGAPFEISPSNPSSSFLEAVDFVTKYKPAGLHVRRGDYIKLDKTHGLLGAEYFKLAIEQLVARGYTDFLVSSDDRDWLRDNRHVLPKVNFLNSLDFGNLSAAEVLSINTLTKAFVCSNSSFSWWSAFSRDKDVVVVPSPWYRGMPEPNQLIQPNRVIRVPSGFY